MEQIDDPSINDFVKANCTSNIFRPLSALLLTAIGKTNVIQVLVRLLLLVNFFFVKTIIILWVV